MLLVALLILAEVEGARICIARSELGVLADQLRRSSEEFFVSRQRWHCRAGDDVLRVGKGDRSGSASTRIPDFSFHLALMLLPLEVDCSASLQCWRRINF